MGWCLSWVLPSWGPCQLPSVPNSRGASFTGSSLSSFPLQCPEHPGLSHQGVLRPCPIPLTTDGRRHLWGWQPEGDPGREQPRLGRAVPGRPVCGFGPTPHHNTPSQAVPRPRVKRSLSSCPPPQAGDTGQVSGFFLPLAPGGWRQAGGGGCLRLLPGTAA